METIIDTKEIIDVRCEYLKSIPPKCKQCRYPDKDDEKRLMAHLIDGHNQRPIIVVKCPSLKCANGWFTEKASKHINMEVCRP